jgi:hypothetical protein
VILNGIFGVQNGSRSLVLLPINLYAISLLQTDNSFALTRLYLSDIASVASGKRGVSAPLFFMFVCMSPAQEFVEQRHSFYMVPPEAGMEVEGAYPACGEASRVPQWDERESIRSTSRIAGKDCNCRAKLRQNPLLEPHLARSRPIRRQNCSGLRQ